ncbi:MAG: TetR/AcrR family transcriptional regulator C-terminal domain-containing protein [Chloroflexota bacterium]
MLPNKDSQVDLRIQRTQEQIRDAFINLLLERPFAQITVTAVAEAARINRATFYRHYHDIHDLAAQLTDLLFADVVTQGVGTPGVATPGVGTPFENDTEPGHAANWEALFIHVAAYAPFYRAMLQPDGIPGFSQRVEAAVAQQMSDLLPLFGFDERQAAMPTALAVRYMAAAQVGFMQWWLENEMPFPPETAAVYLVDLHQRGGAAALGLPLP